jgi:hypothetical protein
MEPVDRVQIEGAVPTKVSTQYDEKGKVLTQWVQEKAEDAARLSAWREIADELIQPIPKAPRIPAPRIIDSDLLVGYPIGDHHIGMLAWGKETGGSSWDLKIAEKALMQATGYLMRAAPPAKQAVVAFLGDFMHYDGVAPVTPTAGNILDADDRYPKMIRSAIRCMRQTIDAAAAKHSEVRVIVEIGNHDLASAVFLQEAMHVLYEGNPRVSIDTSPAHYHFHEFGVNLIGTHHGHGPKTDKLPGIMATDQAAAWGRTKHRVWWTGHIHHTQVHEFPGCTVESFRVLAPKDAWHHQHGYRSERDMKAIVLHREHGEVSRLTVNPGMFV